VVSRRRPAPERSAGLTSQGHPLTIFRRSIEVGNVVAAELAAREMRGLSLTDALDFTALVALRNRERSRRMAARWLQRWLDDTPGATIDDAVMVAGCLAALGGPRHEAAVLSLRAVSGRPLAGET
jgi:hypothetical protein